MTIGETRFRIQKETDIALKLIDKCLERAEQPGVVLIEAG